MRVVVLTSSYPRYEGDGVAPFVKSISEQMAKLGHHVEVVAPYDPEVKPSSSNSIKVHRFRYIWPTRLHIMGHAKSLQSDIRLNPLSYALLPFFILASYLTLSKVVERQKSQVIHVHWVLPNGPVAALVSAIQGIPFVVSLHGSDMFIATRNWLFRAIAKWVFQKAGAVTACSSDLREAAIKLGAPKNTLLLAWGADPLIFHPNRRSQKQRRAFGWNDSEIITIALGRMVYKKGFASLIEALPQVVNNYPNVRLVLGGDGVLKERLVRRASELSISKHISFTGRISWNQVPDYLACADIFVLPSIRDKYGNIDGLPTVLIEAMGSGVAIIASDIGGVNLVIENNLNGVIVSPGDPAEIADAIILLVKDSKKRETLGQAARKSVEQRFNWEIVTKEVLTLLETVVQ